MVLKIEAILPMGQFQDSFATSWSEAMALGPDYFRLWREKSAAWEDDFLTFAKTHLQDYKIAAEKLDRGETLALPEASLVASIESVGMFLNPRIDWHGPVNGIDDMARVVYRTTRTLELAGMIKPIARDSTDEKLKDVLLIASGNTWHEALGLSAQVNIKNVNKLEEILDAFLERDPKDWSQCWKDIQDETRKAVAVDYAPAHFEAFDPDRNLAILGLKDIENIILPEGVDVTFHSLTLEEFLRSNTKKYSAGLFLRADPNMFLGEKEGDIEKIFMQLLDLVDSGELLVSCMEGFDEEEKQLRSFLLSLLYSRYKGRPFESKLIAGNFGNDQSYAEHEQSSFAYIVLQKPVSRLDTLVDDFASRHERAKTDAHYTTKEREEKTKRTEEQFDFVLSHIDEYESLLFQYESGEALTPVQAHIVASIESAGLFFIPIHMPNGPFNEMDSNYRAAYAAKRKLELMKVLKPLDGQRKILLVASGTTWPEVFALSSTVRITNTDGVRNLIAHWKETKSYQYDGWWEKGQRGLLQGDIEGFQYTDVKINRKLHFYAFDPDPAAEAYFKEESETLDEDAPDVDFHQMSLGQFLQQPEMGFDLIFWNRAEPRIVFEHDYEQEIDTAGEFQTWVQKEPNVKKVIDAFVAKLVSAGQICITSGFGSDDMDSLRRILLLGALYDAQYYSEWTERNFWYTDFGPRDDAIEDMNGNLWLDVIEQKPL